MFPNQGPWRRAQDRRRTERLIMGVCPVRTCRRRPGTGEHWRWRSGRTGPAIGLDSGSRPRRGSPPPVSRKGPAPPDGRSSSLGRRRTCCNRASIAASVRTHKDAGHPRASRPRQHEGPVNAETSKAHSQNHPCCREGRLKTQISHSDTTLGKARRKSLQLNPVTDKMTRVERSFSCPTFIQHKSQSTAEGNERMLEAGASQRDACRPHLVGK